MTETVVRNGSLREFEEAFKSAAQGDRIVYHIGRELTGQSGLYASYLHEHGLVLLVQRRSKAASGYFEYIAVRTKRRGSISFKMPHTYRRAMAQ